MKKFTLLFTLMAFVLISTGQNLEMLQKRMNLAKEKYSVLSQSNPFFRDYSGIQPGNVLPSEKFLKSATASMKLDSSVTKTWISETEVWQNETKDEYLYDSEMRNTVWLNSDWNATSKTWETWSKTEMEYNQNGSVSKMYFYESYEQGAEPTLINTLYTFYNDSGQLDSVQHWYTEDQQTWNLEGKQIYHYNNSGQVTEMAMWTLEEDEGEEYMAAMRFVFTYTNTGRMETSSMFFLFEEDEMLFFKTEYFYDNSGRLSHTEDLSLNLMSPTFELEKNTRTDFEYNASGDVSTETWSEWNQADETWVVLETDEYTYNSFNNSEILFPSYLIFFGIVEEVPVSGKAIDEIETMEWTEGTSQLSANTIFYYSAGTSTFADRFDKIRFSMFPNPATESVTFSWDGNREMLNLEVYHITGARVLERQINSGVPVSVSALKKGIYLYKLQNGKETLHSGKLIKK